MTSGCFFVFIPEQLKLSSNASLSLFNYSHNKSLKKKFYTTNPDSVLLKPLLFITLLCITLATQAQTVRKYSNEFLNIGVGAAAFGQSNAVVASTSNVNAGYWNPAGLMRLESPQVSVMHASYFANIANYDYIGGAMPLDDKSAVAFSMIRFGVD